MLCASSGRPVLSDLIGGAWSRLTDRGSKKRHANATRLCAANSIRFFPRKQRSLALTPRRCAKFPALEIPFWPNRIQRAKEASFLRRSETAFLHTPDAAAAERLLELATEHLKQAKARSEERLV